MFHNNYGFVISQGLCCLNIHLISPQSTANFDFSFAQSALLSGIFNNKILSLYFY